MTADQWYASGSHLDINDFWVFINRSGTGQALFCIHGFPSSSWDFESIWPALTERFDTFAHDLIGLGQSSKPRQKLTVSMQADVIEALAKAHSISEAHLLAHDLGDTVAQELLARQQEGRSTVRWMSCVLMNGGLFPETHRALLTQKLLLSSMGPLIANFMSKKTLRKSFQNIFGKATPPSETFIEETWRLLSMNGGKAMIPRLIQYMIERKTHRERWVRPLIDGIVPIRLINGVEDPISGGHMAKRFDELVPNADIVYLEKVGHYPHVEAPKDVIRAMFEFHERLKSVPQ